MGARSGDRRPPSWRGEAVSLLCCLVAVALWFALTTQDAPRNLLGPVGRDVADHLTAAFGRLAYGLAGGLALASFAGLLGALGGLRISHLGWGAVAGSGFALLMDRFGRAVDGAQAAWAGALGAELAGHLTGLVGPLGCALVGMAALLVPLLAVFQVSIRRALLDAASAGAWGLRWLRDRVRSVTAEPWARRLAWAEGPDEPKPTERRRSNPPPSKTRSSPPKKKSRAPVGRSEGRKDPGAKGESDRPSSPPKKAAPPELPPEPALEAEPWEDDEECREVDRVLFGPEPDEGSEAEVVAPKASPAPKGRKKKEPVPPPPPEPEEVLEGELLDSEGPVILERRPTEAPPAKSKTIRVEVDRKTYELPPLHLLDYQGENTEPVDSEALRGRATRLEQKLKTYGVEGRVTAIRPGPVVTTYEYQPAPGVKVSKIANLADDIAMSMEAVRVRIVAPIPGRGVVGIELPNDSRENVYLKELVAHERFQKSSGLLTLAMGKDVEGDVQVRDLQKMPHLLIAGTTGSGKSVSINTMILSILYKATPDEVKFIMVDPKMLELSLYNDIPHLLLPVVTDPRKASRALQWAVDEMERRYQLLSDLKVREIDGFNRKLLRLREARKSGETEPRGDEPPKFKDPWPGQDLPEAMPYIVVLIDEFADLMCVAPRDVEASVQRLAQKARAAGIHVLLATQRPSTDVITGVIKNNFPSRVSFRVASRHDSATVLNTPGAENLLGRGDSLFLSVASPLPERIHGGFVSEEEVERVVEFWKKQARPSYDPTILQPKEDEGDLDGDREDADEHYDLAVKLVTESRRASISGLQRRLRVGYNRAARMIEMMEREGIVGPAVGAKGEREVLVPAPPED